MKEAPRPADQATAKKSFGSFNRAAASKRTAPDEPTLCRMRPMRLPRRRGGARGHRCPHARCAITGHAGPARRGSCNTSRAGPAANCRRPWRRPESRRSTREPRPSIRFSIWSTRFSTPRILSKGGKFGSLYRRMKRLVIDEISMVRADIIDAIDARLRQVRGDKRPFGGVQIVMVGDFLQLPPVVQEQDRPMLDGLGYAAPYAFNAHILQALPVADRGAGAGVAPGRGRFHRYAGRVRSREGVAKRWRGSMRAASAAPGRRQAAHADADAGSGGALQSRGPRGAGGKADRISRHHRAGLCAGSPICRCLSISNCRPVPASWRCATTRRAASSTARSAP